MANEHLKKMKELAGLVDNKTASQSTRGASSARQIVNSVSSADREIERLTEEFYSPVVDNQEEYSTNKEYELIKKIRNNEVTGNFERSNIPRAILESIKNNPLMLDPSMSTIDSSPQMQALTDKLSAGADGVNRMKEIQRTLESKSKPATEAQPINEVATQSAIDYSMIKMIVEKVLDEKLSMLNESRSVASDALKCLTIKNDKFVFLTENGLIYECEMKYKGKNKKH